MASGGKIYIPSFMKIGTAVQNLYGGCTHTHSKLITYLKKKINKLSQKSGRKHGNAFSYTNCVDYVTSKTKSIVALQTTAGC
jgi:hypothetical protein